VSLGLENVSALPGWFPKNGFYLLRDAGSEYCTQALNVSTGWTIWLFLRAKIKVTRRGIVPVGKITTLIEEKSKHIVVVNDGSQRRTPELFGKFGCQRLNGIDILVITDRVECNRAIADLWSDNGSAPAQCCYESLLFRSLQRDITVKCTHRCGLRQYAEPFISTNSKQCYWILGGKRRVLATFQ
jgi:hypothetical protein